jgi:hypothetical protein
MPGLARRGYGDVAQAVGLDVDRSPGEDGPMTSVAAGPALQKGAIAYTDPTTQVLTAIPFQYNPASLKRSLEAQEVGGEPGGHSANVRYTGSPTETVSLDIEIDALSTSSTVGSAVESLYGIYPQLAALELLIYPSTTALAANAASLAAGSLEIAPYVAPLVQLVWGQNRSMPVKLQSYSIVEQTFAPNLNPLRATVSLTAQVLSASDLAPGSDGYNQFIVYQQAKESFAAMAKSRSPGS